MIEKIPYDAAADMKELGSTADVGDVNYSPLERLWYRPTLEIVGMQGGYTAAEGFASIIPGSATAKIMCRLVSNQSADEVIKAIVRHIDKHCPEGATVTYKFVPASSRAMKFPADTKEYGYLSDVLTSAYGRPPLQTAVGGSIGPLVDIKEQLGLYPYSFGVQLPDEKFHASNEFVRLASLRKGQLLYCTYFLHLAEQERKLKRNSTPSQ